MLGAVPKLTAPNFITLEGGVSWYSEVCHNRSHSIWTLETVDGKKKAATIAVELPDLIICEFRGKRNSVPTRKAENFLIAWAEQNGLCIPYWMYARITLNGVKALVSKAQKPLALLLSGLEDEL